MAAPLIYNGPGRLYVTIAAGTEQEFYCELENVFLSATSTVLEFEGPCGKEKIVKQSDWALNVGHAQDLSAATTLTRVSFAHDTEKADYLFCPLGTTKETISDSSPGYSGTCIIAAGNIGGGITEVAKAAPVWPVNGKPVEVVEPLAA